MNGRQTILITGALGQDGSLLAEYLLGLGHEVIGIVRELTDASLAAPVGARLMRADLADEAATRTLLRAVRPNEIYHLAAVHHATQELGANLRVDVYRDMLNMNFLATRSLAFAMLEICPQARLVFAASSQMYSAGSAIPGACLEVDETTRREPSTFYGHSKSWSADLLAFLRREAGLHASSAILFNHESPRRRPQFVTRKITRMAAAAASQGSARGGKLELMNIGARVDWSSAGDVVRALHLMAQAGLAEDYVVASGSLHTVRDVLEVAFGHVGLDWREHVAFEQDAPAAALVGRPEKIERVLGWRRLTGFEQMIAEMVDSDLRQFSRDAPG
jgi:GDPmannose 4,6-dehydratase